MCSAGNGVTNPTSPGFPAQGSSTTWTCGGSNGGGSSVDCTASRATPPINGICNQDINHKSLYSAPTTTLCSSGLASAVTGSGPWNWICSPTNGGIMSESCSANKKVDGLCGDAAKLYSYNVTTFSGAKCSAGDGVNNPPSPTFPAQGGSVAWTCPGSYSGVGVTCTASRALQPITATCSVSHSATAPGYEVVWTTANVQGGNGVYTYAWSGSESLFGSASSIKKTYSNIGIKTGQVTITSGTASTTIICSNDVEVVNFSCSLNSASNNVGKNVIWTASAVTGGASAYSDYSWSNVTNVYFPNNTNPNNTNTVTTTYDTTGTKSMSANARSNTRSVWIDCPEVNIKPAVTFTCIPSATTAYAGQTITWTISGESGGDGVYTYSWSNVTDVLYPTTANPITTKTLEITYNTLGTYSMSASVQSGGPNKYWIECPSKVTVNNNPADIPSVTLTTGATTLKNNATTSLTWIVAKANTCTASSTDDMWTGTKSSTGGTITIGGSDYDSSKTYSFSLSCVSNKGIKTEVTTAVTVVPTCTSLNYTYGTCSASGLQTKTATGVPVGCSGGVTIPTVTTQICTPPCTSYTLESWGDCIWTSDGSTTTRSREVTTFPQICAGGISIPTTIEYGCGPAVCEYGFTKQPDNSCKASCLGDTPQTYVSKGVGFSDKSSTTPWAYTPNKAVTNLGVCEWRCAPDVGDVSYVRNGNRNGCVSGTTVQR
jgi:hypothetical protein